MLIRMELGIVLRGSTHFFPDQADVEVAAVIVECDERRGAESGEKPGREVQAHVRESRKPGRDENAAYRSCRIQPPVPKTIVAMITESPLIVRILRRRSAVLSRQTVAASTGNCQP